MATQQGWRKCCSAVALLRAEQGPCEPSKGFVSKFGEPERAWESQREPERAGQQARESLRVPERVYVAISGSLLLSLALSQSERARENLCGPLWLSVVLSLWLTLALSLALWLVLSLSDSLSLWFSSSLSPFWLSVKHVFLFNVDFLLIMYNYANCRKTLKYSIFFREKMDSALWAEKNGMHCVPSRLRILISPGTYNIAST